MPVLKISAIICSRHWARFDYTPQDCYAFHEAIEKEIVPILHEQAEKRKKALALDTLNPGIWMWMFRANPL